MKIAMMQPCFIPWQGLFELIVKSDKFVFLDDYQCSYRSYSTRNTLFINGSSIGYYSVPVQKSESSSLSYDKTLLIEDNGWKLKMMRRISRNYSKSPYYDEVIPDISSWINTNFRTLKDINVSFIQLTCKLMKIEKIFFYSSDFTKETKSQSKRSQRIFEILKWIGADCYLSANGSFDYMLEDKVFPNNEIRVLFQNFTSPKYDQVSSPSVFVPRLSVLDSLFNVGGLGTYQLILQGTKKWLTWEERFDRI